MVLSRRVSAGSARRPDIDQMSPGSQPAWGIHFITRYRPTADLIIARLAEAGAIFELPGQAG